MSDTASLNELRLSAGAASQAERNIAWILQHPGFSDWLKDTLRSAVRCDPVQLANDLELLGHLLRAWSGARIEEDRLRFSAPAVSHMRSRT